MGVGVASLINLQSVPVERGVAAYTKHVRTPTDSMYGNGAFRTPLRILAQHRNGGHVFRFARVIGALFFHTFATVLRVTKFAGVGRRVHVPLAFPFSTRLDVHFRVGLCFRC